MSSMPVYKRVIELDRRPVTAHGKYYGNQDHIRALANCFPILYFLVLFTGLEVELSMDNHYYVVLGKENVDIAIRIGMLKDSSMVTRKIGEI